MKRSIVIFLMALLCTSYAMADFIFLTELSMHTGTQMEPLTLEVFYDPGMDALALNGPNAETPGMSFSVWLGANTRKAVGEWFTLTSDAPDDIRQKVDYDAEHSYDGHGFKKVGSTSLSHLFYLNEAGDGLLCEAPTQLNGLYAARSFPGGTLVHYMSISWLKAQLPNGTKVKGEALFMQVRSDAFRDLTAICADPDLANNYSNYISG